MKNEDVFTWLTLVQQFVDFLLSQFKIRAKILQFSFLICKKKSFTHLVYLLHKQ